MILIIVVRISIPLLSDLPLHPLLVTLRCIVKRHSYLLLIPARLVTVSHLHSYQRHVTLLLFTESSNQFLC